MTIEGILDELESLVIDSGHVPFTNKRILEEDDIVRLLDELREKLPGELTEANRIVADKQRYLEKAQEEAQKIIDQAKSHAAKLTDENMIAKQAQEHSDQIVLLAHKEADELRKDAVAYASNVFQHLEDHLQRALEVVHQGHKELNQPPRK